MALLKFTVPPQKDRSANEAVLDNVLQQVGRLFTARIRQSAVAVRYARNTLALILADTKEKEARHTLDRLRLEMANPLPVFTAGIAEAVLQQGYEPADVITELINRTEDALQTARGRAAILSTYRPPGTKRKPLRDPSYFHSCPHREQRFPPPGI